MGLLLALSSMSGGASPVTGGGGGSPQPILFLSVLESNAGGIASNSDATDPEMASHPLLKIWHRTSNVFQSLQIGVNNLLGHTGLESYFYTSHGIELQLANLVEAGVFGDAQIFLAKGGHGGSRADQWLDGGTISGIDPYATLQAEVNAAKAAIVSLTGQTPRIICFFTQGINDIIASTPALTWKGRIHRILDNMDADFGIESYWITNFYQAADTGYNSTIAAIISERSNCHLIDTKGAVYDGGHHWIYLGFKQIVNSWITSLLSSLNPVNLSGMHLVADGNSYVIGYPSYTSFPNVLMSLSPFSSNGATMDNFGVGGRSTVEMLTDEASQVLSTYNSSVDNVILFQEGGNDIFTNGSVSAAIARLTTYCNNAKATGFKIIVSTLIHRNQSTAFGDDATAYNAKIDSFNSTLIGLAGIYDGIIRPDIEAIFSTYSSGGYHSDEVHPNQTGQNKYAELYKNELLTLAGV